MRHRYVAVAFLALLIIASRCEYRHTSVAELWIMQLPLGFEFSLQRIQGSATWTPFLFNDSGA